MKIRPLTVIFPTWPYHMAISLQRLQICRLVCFHLKYLKLLGTCGGRGDIQKV